MQLGTWWRNRSHQLRNLGKGSSSLEDSQNAPRELRKIKGAASVYEAQLLESIRNSENGEMNR